MSTNISEGKIFNYLDRVFGKQNPITADIFLTNYCNNRCNYCTYKRWDLNNNNYFMNFIDFKKYIKRLKELGVVGFILTGGGEPTINPEFDNIAKFLTENKLHWGINTNFNILKYISPDYLKISLDGYNNETYKNNRGVNHYTKVIDNIKAYLDWKYKNNITTTVGIQMVAITPEDVLEFYNAHKNLRIDYISIRPIESTNGEYYKNKNFNEIINTINILNQKDKRIIANFKWKLIGEQEKNCTANWSQIAINEYGDVMYCCHKPYEIIGNIMDNNILEKKKNHVTNMQMCDIPCRLTAPNKEYKNLIEPKKDIYFI